MDETSPTLMDSVGACGLPQVPQCGLTVNKTRIVTCHVKTNSLGMVMNIPIYIGKRYETDSASCKHDQNGSMSVGSRKAVRCGLSFNIKVLAYCGAEPQALKKLEKCEKSG